MKLKDIFMVFFKTGMLGFGGGLSAIPLMQREVVDEKGWMEEDEFSDVLALANTLPGPINTKIAGYIGWQLLGWRGLLTAIIGAAVPSLILMILLLTVLNAYKDKAWVQGMTKGVLPVAGVMIGVLAWDFVKISYSLMGSTPTLALLGISIVVLNVLGIHPAILILALLLTALFSKGDQKKGEQTTP